MNKTILSVIFALAAFASSSQEFESGGLRYRILSDACGEVEVVSHWEWGENTYSGVVIVPQSVHYDGANYSVTAVGEAAFAHSAITQAVLPNTVTAIGEGAFENAADMHSITLPVGLKSLGNWCFAHTQLVNVAVPEGVKTIPEGAFYGCNMLHTVFVPASAQRIGAYAFAYCHNLYELYFAGSTPPDAVGWGAFDGARKADVVLRNDDIADRWADDDFWGDASRFGVFANEAAPLEIEASTQTFGTSWLAAKMPGVSLCYRVYNELGELTKVTAAQTIYLPATDHDTWFTIVPVTLTAHSAELDIDQAAALGDFSDDAITVGVPQTTAIDNIIDDSEPQRAAPQIFAREGIIFVQGDTYGEWTRVYDISGRLRFIHRAFSGQIANLPRGEVYIVTVGKHSKKVRL